MRVIGVLAGVGSLLYEAEQAGFDVVGNFETRTPFRTSPFVWEANFPGKPLLSTPQFTDDWREADLLLGHPPCNNYSVLGHMKTPAHAVTEEAKRAWRLQRNQKQGLLPLFIEQVRTLRPRIFAMDNLPRALKHAAPPSWWAEVLPEYRCTFIVMTNYHYGTPQLRKRLWVVGVRGKRPFTFTPAPKRLPGPKTGWEAIRDLPWEPWRDLPDLMHVHKRPNDFPAGGYKNTDDPAQRMLSQVALAHGFLHLPVKQSWPYRTHAGRITFKMGRTRMPMDGLCRVLSGLETLHHPMTGWPLTPRERARIMDWPDTFKLIDTPDRDITRSLLMRLVLFTGKAVPSGFPRYLLPQLIHHIRRK